MAMELGLAAAALCAAAMGFAIQRGATCTVAAMDEILTRRRATRLLAMIEAALWVTGGLLVVAAVAPPPGLPRGYAVGPAVIMGGLLLGIGAQINRACVFGSVARLGNGDWAYLATPLGFLAGCVVFRQLGAMGPEQLPQGSPVLGAPAWAVMLLLPWAGWRLWTLRGWTPHAATLAIGAMFLATLLLAGAWSYTDVLAELSRGMAMGVPARAGLALALLAGAVLGGWLAGKHMRFGLRAPQVARCFMGGALMACGGMLVPGSNDGLVLLAMPLLYPYAWVAFVAMCAGIAATRAAEAAWRAAGAHPA